MSSAVYRGGGHLFTVITITPFTTLRRALELMSGLEPPNLFITNEVLYRLSYISIISYYHTIIRYSLFNCKRFLRFLITA